MVATVGNVFALLCDSLGADDLVFHAASELLVGLEDIEDVEDPCVAIEDVRGHLISVVEVRLKQILYLILNPRNLPLYCPNLIGFPIRKVFQAVSVMGLGT